ncbi:MAG: hypothetical protein U0326_23475 [Polyangiales bacterium]
MLSTTQRLAVMVCVSALGCSGAQSPQRPRGPLTARDYFPLRANAAWSYDTQTGYGGDTVLSALAVVRVDGSRYYVRSGARTETYEIRADGVVREGDYVLRDPIRVGATWDARDGSHLAIRAVGATRTVGQRQYHNVIEVLRSGSSARIETTTWYAADVGAIEIHARTTSSLGQEIEVHSTLRGFDLGDSQ